MFRQLALGAASVAALALFAPVAQAADLPAYEPAPAVIAPAAFTWTGPYVGIQGGHSWGRASKARPDGWLIGGYLGYNYQVEGSPVVVGIETDINWADIDDKRGSPRGGTTKVSSDWNGATRARLGYAFDRFLVYGAAGVAYSDREIKRPGGKDSKTAVGWTVGGGVEYAATDNIAIRAEYRYNDYGKDKFSLGNSVKSSYTDQRAMVGVAYKFDSPF
ncbi:outer membrane protein [Hansschlegelia plantiphila]|uniref:Outer membrane protein n=1 Tax=Hansschlegelia plantiphila TaxID=374655 RepID=A0A9W6MVK0_9HYPH|nr:outer membrane protein [Hansschlegelia plantiphila]GLK67810.1 outer membrane protein [Hansschlegelia plantiphila]